MEFRGLEASIMEVLKARELQRLRRIRQLGLVHLVFPGAEHSRLVHSLGAAHLALRFSRRLEHCTQDFLAPALRPDEESRRDLGLAALTHDLGHGPLSHVWEQEVVENYDVDEWAKKLGLSAEHIPPKPKWHELVGLAMLIDPDTEIHRILEAQETGLPERIATMLRGEYHLPYLPSLLSGDVDVDRCDYVLRDAAQAGVAYGHVDLDWLISTATVGATEHGSNLVVGFDERKAHRVIEQFLVARRALYDNVYQHKTVRSAEGMVGRFLRRVMDLIRDESWPANKSEFRQFQKVLGGGPASVSDLLKLDDYSLWVMLIAVAEKQDDKIASDLARRVVGRELFKRVPVDTETVDNFLGRHNRSELEAVIAEALGLGDGEGTYYLVYDFNPFETIGRGESRAAYLVSEPGDGPGQATLARQHHALAHLSARNQTEKAFYAPKEVVEELAEVISG
jgi:HD superfamily phosphohydrolase